MPPVAKTRDQLLQEYVASGVHLGVLQMRNALTTLPQYSDEATRTYGDDVYERMMRDSCIGPNVRTLVALTLKNGIQWTPAIEGPQPGQKFTAEEQRRYDKAVAIADEFAANIDRLPDPLVQTSAEMLRDALTYGCKVAELNWVLSGGKLVLTSIKTKPRKSTGFVVDAYMNVKGVVSLVAADGSFMAPGLILQEDNASILPRTKFLVLTYDKRDGDPRGHSSLEICYDPWYIKRQARPEYLKYLVQFASPSLVGVTAENEITKVELDENGQEKFDSAGNPVEITAEEALLQSLLTFQNGTAITVPHGSDVKTLFEQSDGKAFESAFKLLNGEITYAQLSQMRATLESEYGSRADSEGGKDILDVIIEGLQNLVQQALFNDVARVWVTQNYGELIADEFTPKPVLSSGAAEDFGKNAEGVSRLFTAGYISDDQLPHYDAKLGAPVRDMEAWAKEKAATEAAREQAIRDRSRLESPEDDAA